MNINSIVKMNNNKTVELAVLATTYPDMDVIAIEASTLTPSSYTKTVCKKPAVLVMRGGYQNKELRTTNFIAKADWESFTLSDSTFCQEIGDLIPWSDIGHINHAEVVRCSSGWQVVVTGRNIETSESDSAYLPLSSIYFTV